MKQNLSNCARRTRWLHTLAIPALLFCLSSFAQDPKPETDRAPEQELKADKAPAKEQPEVRESPRQEQSGSSRDKRWVEAKRELHRAQNALRELRESGKEQEAAEVERRVHMLEAKLEMFQQDAPRDPEAEEFRRDRRQIRERLGGLPGGEVPGPERRLHHLEAAIENLHAAGMHDMAERLAQQRERIRRDPSMGRGDEPRPRMGPDPQVERLRDEVNELKQMVRQLTERVEALSRERH
jgi:hypothetical protein